MSKLTLRSAIQEDYLTCTICFNKFLDPKALPCLHTFCENCLREYVVSRGFEAEGQFPCPICRKTIQIPSGGLQAFPINHLLKSLSDTVDKSNGRPTPKPRRSIQPRLDEPSAALSSSDTSAAVSYIPENQGIQNPATNIPSPAFGFISPAVYRDVDELSLQPVTIDTTPSPLPYTSGPLYPSIPPVVQENKGAACSEGLALRFGKKGASVTDFHKPFGLAVGKSGEYIASDLSGNRIFIFGIGGDLKKALACDCPIKDVAINHKNEILVAVNKPGAAFRCYSMLGQTLGEHGKFLSCEETQGIATLIQGGAVITGKQNHSVYVLTDQYKLSTKFGRKGRGDGYFQSPAFVATDSKNHIIVSDDVNDCVQVFNAQGKFKIRFGGEGSGQGQLRHPQGICTDAEDNIIIADSGNHRVEVFNTRGRHVRTIVSETQRLGENVQPINVALTPQGNVAVLLRGPYFAEIRVYSWSGAGTPLVKDSSTWYLVE